MIRDSLAPAVNLLRRYEAVRRKVMDALQESSKLQIGLSLKYAYSRSRNDDDELSFRIKHVNERTTLVYRNLLIGRLDSVWGLLQTCVENGDIVDLGGVFAAVVTRSRKLSLSLNFGGAGISWGFGTDATANIKVHANGMLDFAASNFSAKNTAKFFGESSSASFGGTLDIASALANPRAALPVTFGFALQYDDNHMKKSELRSYLHSLERAGGGSLLLAESAVEAALRLYESPVDGARINTVVSISADDLQRLFDADQETISDAARASLFLAGAARKDSERILFALLADDDDKSISTLLAELNGSKDEQLAKKYKGKTGETLTTSGLNNKARLTLQDVGSINGLTDHLIDALKALRTAPDIFKALQGKIDGLTPAEIRARYATALEGVNRQVNRGIGPWFERPSNFGDAPAVAIALLATIAKVCKSDDGPLLVPVVQVRDNKGTTKVFAF